VSAVSKKPGCQRIAEGCSIIRPRPNGSLDNLAISLDMDHLLSVVCPAKVCLGLSGKPRRNSQKNKGIKVIFDGLF
jgi:hypothetical protein